MFLAMTFMPPWGTFNYSIRHYRPVIYLSYAIQRTHHNVVHTRRFGDILLGWRLSLSYLHLRSNLGR